MHLLRRVAATGEVHPVGSSLSSADTTTSSDPPTSQPTASPGRRQRNGNFTGQCDVLPCIIETDATYVYVWETNSFREIVCKVEYSVLERRLHLEGEIKAAKPLQGKLTGASPIVLSLSLSLPTLVL